MIHIGASQSSKNYPAFKWRAAIKQIHNSKIIPVVLIGSADEAKDSEFISSGTEENLVVNLVGKTQLTDLFPIIAHSKLLIGCDSAPVHIASLTNTPTLNISFETVNFWETGPLADNARVLFGNNDTDISSELIAKNALQILNSELHDNDGIYRIPNIPAYSIHPDKKGLYSWNLIQAIYMDAPLPNLPTKELYLAFDQLRVTNEIMLTTHSNGKNRRHSAIQINL